MSNHKFFNVYGHEGVALFLLSLGFLVYLGLYSEGATPSSLVSYLGTISLGGLLFGSVMALVGALGHEAANS